jgi:hypothetical protein
MEKNEKSGIALAIENGNKAEKQNYRELLSKK